MISNRLPIRSWGVSMRMPLTPCPGRRTEYDGKGYKHGKWDRAHRRCVPRLWLWPDGLQFQSAAPAVLKRSADRVFRHHRCPPPQFSERACAGDRILPTMVTNTFRTAMDDMYLRSDRWVCLPAAATVASMAALARRGVPRWDDDAFRMINGLPDRLYVPVWPVMQLGSLASVGITAGLARLVDQRPQRAGTVALAGGAAWLVCKPLKRVVNRPRPDPEASVVRIRGMAQTGLGYPSGHAAVAAAMGTVLARGASRRSRGAIALLAATVGAGRVYVGAHYPLDVVGGWAAGLATATLVRSFRR